MRRMHNDDDNDLDGDYYYRSTWRRRLRRDDLDRDDHNDVERLDHDRDDDVNESGGNDDVDDPRLDDSLVRSAGETAGRETAGEASADADEASPVVSRGSPGELAERSLFGSGVRLGEMGERDEPPEVVNAGCLVALASCLVFWIVLVTAIVWLVIR